MTKVRKNKVIAEARNEGKTEHFASLVDLCHLKNSELEPQFQTCKGRAEQGSSASQTTAAKVMDIFQEGQAADAVSAYTQVKMEDAPTSLESPKSECPDTWTRLPRHKWPKSWSSIEDPVPHEQNLYGHPFA